MATYLAMVAIGDFTIQTGAGPHGLPLRNVFATRLAPAAADATARTAEMIEVLESWFGAYPFATYGALVVDDGFGFALETQTLSLFPRSIAVRTTASERIQVHELAHQWFGDSLTLSRWQDIWLNEGFATYAEALWLERTQLGYDIDREMQSLRQQALRTDRPAHGRQLVRRRRVRAGRIGAARTAPHGRRRDVLRDHARLRDDLPPQLRRYRGVRRAGQSPRRRADGRLLRPVAQRADRAAAAGAALTNDAVTGHTRDVRRTVSADR